MFCPLGIELGQAKLFSLMTVKLILNIQQESNKVQISVAQHCVALGFFFQYIDVMPEICSKSALFCSFTAYPSMTV